jgi:hypothetical protein
MSNWVGTPVAQNVILSLAFALNVVTLIFLIKYVRATKGIQEAANKQTAASERLARWQPEQWRRDSRGQEWRELIGTLTTSVLKIEAGPPPHPFVPRTVVERSAGVLFRLSEDIIGGMTAGEWKAFRDECSYWRNEALFAAARVISDRLLIADALEREHIREEWREIELMSGDLPLYQENVTSTDGESATVTAFQQKWAQLRRKLVELARQDLGVAVLPAGTDIGRG